MVVITVFKRWFSRCCVPIALALVLALPTSIGLAADTGQTTAMQTAINNVDYVHSAGLIGLKANNGTHDFSVTAHNICRYIDVGNTPGGAGILIPFATPGEWKRGTGNANTGFIATTGYRSFVRLDFCRAATGNEPVMTNVDYKGQGGISDAANLLNPATQTVFTYTYPQRRVVTTGGQSGYDASLRERQPVPFNMRRTDCMAQIVTYPPGSGIPPHQPCFTWNWVETVTATFTYDNSYGTVAAAHTAAQLPNNTGTGTWSKALDRTCNSGPATSNDGRPVPATSCPPPVTPPVLGTCPPEAHNTHNNWESFQFNLREHIGCNANELESTNPLHNRVYDLQHRLWCFDGHEYPEDNVTRRTNEQIEGFCTTPPTTCTPVELNQSCELSGVSHVGNLSTVRYTNDFNCSGTYNPHVYSNTCCYDNLPNNQLYSWYNVMIPGCDGPPPSYDWVASGFGACSATCGGGTQTQTVSCRRSDGQPAVDSLCNPATRPATSQACNMQACPPVCVEGTEPESIPCGAGFTGMQTRTRTINIGGVCNANSDWSPYDRSACVVVCTAGQHLYNGTCINDCSAYEEHDLCDVASGNFTGTHLQRRTRDTVSCPAFSGPWTDYGANTCTPVAPPACNLGAEEWVNDVDGDFSASYPPQCAAYNYLAPPNGSGMFANFVAGCVGNTSTTGDCLNDVTVSNIQCVAYIRRCLSSSCPATIHAGYPRGTTTTGFCANQGYNFVEEVDNNYSAGGTPISPSGSTGRVNQGILNGQAGEGGCWESFQTDANHGRVRYYKKPGC